LTADPGAERSAVEGVTFDGAVLVGTTARGTTSVEGIGVRVDGRGVTITPATDSGHGADTASAQVDPSHRDQSRTIGWAAIVSASLGPQVMLSDGRLAASIDLTFGGRAIRLLVPRSSVSDAQLTSSAAWFAGRMPAPAAPWGGIGTPGGRHRSRKRNRSLLVVALVLVVGSIGLAVALSNPRPTQRSVVQPAANPSPDQLLAQGLLLTQQDLPSGWQPGTASGPAPSAAAQSAQLQIDQAFTSCMGVSPRDAGVLLGGQAADQTAQASSPVFVGPAPGATAPAGGQGQGAILEIQTGVAVVRTQLEEQHDLGLFGLPRLPGCTAALAASELQLGLDQASGASATPGASTGSFVPLAAPSGLRVIGVTMSLTLIEAGHAVPVVVDQLIVGRDRVEAQLQAFAVGSTFPPSLLASSITNFEDLISSPGSRTSA